MLQDTLVKNLKNAFTYPFRDPGWRRKLLVAVALMLPGIVLLPTTVWVYGYITRMVRRIVGEGREPALPEWADWDGLFRDGFKLVATSMIGLLPALLLFAGSYVLMFGGSLAAPILIEAVEAQPKLAPIGILLAVSGALAGFALLGLTTVLILVAGFFLPIAETHVAVTGQLGAAFRVREWGSILRANLDGFLLAYAVQCGFALLLNFSVQILYFTAVLCCLMPIVWAVLSVYMLLVTRGTLFAQAYRTGVERLADRANGRDRL